MADAASPRARAVWLLLCGAVFELAYLACNLAAQRAQVSRHVAVAWDAGWPFVPWMIVPYGSSVPLLLLGFALAVDRQALRAYGQRLLLCTVLGCAVFALWPLAFHGPRPQPAEPLWAALFGWLHVLDAPFNQWPSLHVAFMVVLWPTARQGIASQPLRVLLAAWLVLVAASTVFTHQHHLADVPGGLLLGGLACRLVPPQRSEPAVALHYSVAALLALILALTLPANGFTLLLVWCALCTAAVAWAYARRDAGFLHKRDGRFPLWVRALYGPYLAGYFVTWWLVRWRERAKPPVQQVATNLWVGRRLTAHEAATLLPGRCSVVDLANELAETPALRPGPEHRYHAVPCLDLLPLPEATRAHLVQHVRHELAQGHTVFLHCAMGYRRSIDVAQAVLDHPVPNAA